MLSCLHRQFLLNVHVKVGRMVNLKGKKRIIKGLLCGKEGYLGCFCFWKLEKRKRRACENHVSVFICACRHGTVHGVCSDGFMCVCESVQTQGAEAQN